MSLEITTPQPESSTSIPELEKVFNFFDLKDIDLKEVTCILLQRAYEIFTSESLELSQEKSLEIDGERFFLQYNIYLRKSGSIWVRVGLFKKQPPALIQNTSAFNEGEVAMTRQMFNFERGDVNGEVATDADFEGRGFGRALLFMREGIIRNIMRRFRDRITSEVIKSEITDNSRSSNAKKYYEGWTSFMAQKMGYEQVGENKFVKLYKPE